MSIAQYVIKVSFQQDTKSYHQSRDAIDELHGSLVIQQTIGNSTYFTHANDEGYSPLNSVLDQLSRVPEFQLSGRSFYIERIDGDSVFCFSINNGVLESIKIVSNDFDFGTLLTIDDLYDEKYKLFIGAQCDDFDHIRDMLSDGISDEITLHDVSLKNENGFHFKSTELVQKGASPIVKFGGLVLLIGMTLGGYTYYLDQKEAERLANSQDVDPWLEYSSYVSLVTPAPHIFTEFFKSITVMENVNGWGWSSASYQAGALSYSLMNLEGHIDELLRVKEIFPQTSTRIHQGNFILASQINQAKEKFPYKLFNNMSEVNYVLYMCLSAKIGAEISYIREARFTKHIQQVYQLKMSNPVIDQLHAVASCMTELPVNILKMELVKSEAGESFTLDFETFASI